MARTTATEVKAIMDNCQVSESDIETYYIPAANELVTKTLGSDTSIGATLMEQVECWFTAHMLASSRERVAQKEELGKAKVEYTGKSGLNLEVTPYGQMVLTLDITGKMANLSKKGASIYALTSFD